MTVEIIDHLVSVRFRDAALCYAKLLLADPATVVQSFTLLQEITKLFCDGEAAFLIGCAVLNGTYGGLDHTSRARNIAEGLPSGDAVDVDNALLMMEAARVNHYPDALHGVTMCFYEGAYTPELYDFDVERKEFRPKAEAAAYIKQLGSMLISILSDFDTTRELYQLADIYKNGLFYVEKDEKKAAELWQKIVNMNSEDDKYKNDSLYHLSMAYEQGKGVEKNIEKAAELKLKLGDENHTVAQEWKISMTDKFGDVSK